MLNPDDDQTALAYRSIRRMILDGGLPPGHRMSNRTLAEKLGIGRSPIREAVLQLEAEGLVVQRAQKGILIRELSPQEFAEVYELRLALEPLFAERAAARATPVHLAAMRASCEDLREVARQADLAGWLAEPENRRRLCQLDMQLHAQVLAAAGNSMATRLFSGANILVHSLGWDRCRPLEPASVDVIKLTALQHMAIYEAIRDRDAAAARDRMREHILAGIEAMTTRYAQAVEAEGDAELQAAAARAAAAVRRCP
jgi:DNA-binding GntR family transcriptional regulator